MSVGDFLSYYNGRLFFNSCHEVAMVEDIQAVDRRLSWVEEQLSSVLEVHMKKQLHTLDKLTEKLDKLLHYCEGKLKSENSEIQPEVIIEMLKD